jgi:thiamine monophosphate kinase
MIEYHHPLVEEYYLSALQDLSDGLLISDLREIMNDFEEHELYIECAGIKKAIDLIEKIIENETKNKNNYKS